MRQAVDRDRRRATASRAFGAGAIAALVLSVGALWTPSDAVVVCPLRLLTGLACPSCGLTRSVAAALHGHMGQALALHPLGPLVVLVAVVVFVLSVAQLAGRPWLDGLARFGTPLFFLCLAIETIFVWPFHLHAQLSAGWSTAWNQGLIARSHHVLMELLHAL
jgi:hypothetical protein